MSKKLCNNMKKIQAYENRIFMSVSALKSSISKNFKVENDSFEIVKNAGFDDQLGFFEDGYYFSVWYMTGSSGRIIVVETTVSNIDGEE